MLGNAFGGVAQLARAFEWHSKGQGFNSPYLHLTGRCESSDFFISQDLARTASLSILRCVHEVVSPFRNNVDSLKVLKGEPWVPATACVVGAGATRG